MTGRHTSSHTCWAMVAMHDRITLQSYALNLGDLKTPGKGTHADTLGQATVPNDFIVYQRKVG